MWWSSTSQNDDSAFPTVQTREEFEYLADKTLTDLLELEKGGELDGWVEITNPNEEFRLFERTDKNGFSCLRTSGVISCSAKALLNFMYSQDLPARQRWDKDLEDWKIIENITDDIQVVYRCYRAPAYGVAGRDFVALQAKKILLDGTCVSYGRSINYSTTFPLNSSYVRANAIVSGIICRPLEGSPNKCHCTRIIHLDPKGNIPAWVIRLGKKRSISSFIEFRKVAEIECKTQEELISPLVSSDLFVPQAQTITSEEEQIQIGLGEEQSNHGALLKVQNSLQSLQVILNTVQQQQQQLLSDIRHTQEILNVQLRALERQFEYQKSIILLKDEISFNKHFGWALLLCFVLWPLLYSVKQRQ